MYNENEEKWHGSLEGRKKMSALEINSQSWDLTAEKTGKGIAKRIQVRLPEKPN